MAEKQVKGLCERLKDGEHVMVAEGYLVEFEKRGYLRNDTFTPEVVLEHPELVTILSEEFARAGSDVVEAYTYYGHRGQLRKLGLEDETEKLNRLALRIAKDVARRYGKLMAGNLSNTLLYNPDDPESHEKIKAMFKEQVEWATDEGADFIIGETFMEAGEAYLALDAIQKYGKGLPSVITVVPFTDGKMNDGVTWLECCRTLEERGASVVGVNCGRGPDTMVPVVKELRATLKGPIACVVNPYRTDAAHPCFYFMEDARTGQRAFPDQMDALLCSRGHIEDFTNQVKDMVQYIGLCCGNRAHYTLSMCKALGRKPESFKWSSAYKDKLTVTSEVDKEYTFFRGKWRDQLIAAGVNVEDKPSS